MSQILEIFEIEPEVFFNTIGSSLKKTNLNETESADLKRSKIEDLKKLDIRKKDFEKLSPADKKILTNQLYKILDILLNG